jgi:hypothetical protein
VNAALLKKIRTSCGCSATTLLSIWPTFAGVTESAFSAA